MNRSGRHPGEAGKIRIDLLRIAEMVEPGSRVLDIGCGDGALLDHLVRQRGADARGIEISQEGVNACVARGLSVVQGDADTDLGHYPTGAFDYAILSQTLQATHRPREVIEQLLRIGKRAIVSFPNFGHWRVRLQLLGRGRMPDTRTLDVPWFETPNIHLCTIRDFVILCRDLGITIERRLAIGHQGAPIGPLAATFGLANLFGDQGLFFMRYDGERDEDGCPVYGRPRPKIGKRSSGE